MEHGTPSTLTLSHEMLKLYKFRGKVMDVTLVNLLNLKNLSKNREDLQRSVRFE